ncbi:MAG: transcriptional regulator [Bacteroidota bacterium]
MTDPRLPSDAFRLGALVVVPSLNRLVRDGQPTDVEPRLMAVLAALAETPGEVVTHDHLLASVWADTVVNDEAVTRAVSELRKALGDGAPGAVETIRGRGYRLTLPVEPIEATPASATPAEPLRGAAAPGTSGGRPLAAVALAVGVIALGVSVWAVLRTGDETPSPSQTTTEAAGTVAAPEDPFRLDSTSEYYRPGLSDHGVYVDDSTGRVFWFAPDSTE